MAVGCEFKVCRGTVTDVQLNTNANINAPPTHLPSTCPFVGVLVDAGDQLQDESMTSATLPTVHIELFAAKYSRTIAVINLRKYINMAHR